jgi:hypothetical protein
MRSRSGKDAILGEDAVDRIRPKGVEAKQQPNKEKLTTSQPASIPNASASVTKEDKPPSAGIDKAVMNSAVGAPTSPGFIADKGYVKSVVAGSPATGPSRASPPSDNANTLSTPTPHHGSPSTSSSTPAPASAPAKEGPRLSTALDRIAGTVGSIGSSVAHVFDKTNAAGTITFFYFSIFF